MKKACEARGQVPAQNDDSSHAANFLCQRCNSFGIQAIAKPLQIMQVSVDRLAHTCRKARPLGFAGLQCVERGGLGDRKLVQVVLELTVI